MKLFYARGTDGSPCTPSFQETRPITKSCMGATSSRSESKITRGERRTLLLLTPGMPNVRHTNRETLANWLSEPFSTGQKHQYLLHCTCSRCMNPHDDEPLTAQKHDKQLQGISLDSVMEKRRLDQALNAKEFAICAGVSYSTARSWFHLPGFPVFHGVIFWQDFVQWRSDQNALKNPFHTQADVVTPISPSNLPSRTAQILFDA